ncbi:flagellar FliL protein [Desulfacinum hydrothermale DSM 13146]|uniref:Flagellar protein FliL n=1 Tax=Desulfacinum hydrothermale DSM 13146 TaxID=1121390 RepID=A0A1W1X769_9BACT|nr:flagellar basal body-associated protein FliL [Desulfacinum hydrothermale]SMC19341.1 flagellar FliL protein [Desulfacinum hydrothermale DSM 13146]
MAKKKEAAPDTPEQQEEKKSPLMKIILLVVLLAVVGGGGFFAYTKFFAGKKEEAKKEAPAPALEKPVMKDLETFLVNLSDPGGERYLKITLQLKLSNEAVLTELDARNAEIRDAILMLLSSKEYDDISSLSGKLALKRALTGALNRILKQGQVLDIYFTEFLVQ